MNAVLVINFLFPKQIINYLNDLRLIWNTSCCKFIYINMWMYTHACTPCFPIYLFVYSCTKSTPFKLLKLHHVLIGGKAIASLLFFLFKICLVIVNFLSRLTWESACQIPYVKPYREVSTTTENRITQIGSTLQNNNKKQNKRNKFHWTSDNEGQWSIRDEKWTKKARQLPQCIA